MIKKTPYGPVNIERGCQTLRGTQSNISPTEPLDVPLGKRQLVMSRSVMEDYYDCRRTVHPVEKHPANPLISAEKEWEGLGPCWGGTVLYDEELGKFRLWTCAMRAGHHKEKGGMHAIYYESNDGLEWERPSLGQYEFQGSTKNNVLNFDPYLPWVVHVFEMPDSHRDRGRFGMVMGGLIPGPPLENDHRMEQFLGFSDDGYKWTLMDEPKPFFKGRADCEQTIVWNPDREVFMYYRRATINAKEIRRIAYTESKDLVNWTQPRLIVSADELDTLYLYGMPVSRYQNIYLGLLQSLYSHPDNEHVKVPKSHEVDIQLAWSHDGFHWERHPERPIFIPTGPIRKGVPDWGMVYAMQDVMDVEDRVYVYYYGREGLHNTQLMPDSKRHICLGTLRRDGFVSLDASREGWALTVPLRCPGGKLHINGKTAGDGGIQVAIREGEGIRDGEWPEEWSLDYATDFVGDSIDHEVNWKGQKDLSSWKGKTIRLEFLILKAELYSFWIE